MGPIKWLEEVMREIDRAGDKCPRVIGWAVAAYIESLDELGEGYPDWMKAWAGYKLDGKPRFVWADEMEE